jgi:hypothetical protein
MAQINARLSLKIRAQFQTYASKVGLDAGELARLLIVREMRRRKILPSARRNQTEARLIVGRSRKLTAHFHHLATVDEFDKFADTFGFNRAAAAKLIFEHELGEMWLAKALLWTPEPRYGKP